MLKRVLGKNFSFALGEGVGENATRLSRGEGFPQQSKKKRESEIDFRQFLSSEAQSAERREGFLRLNYAL